MTLGIVQLGHALAYHLRKKETESLDVMAACIAAAGLIGAGLFVLAAVGLVRIPGVRALGWGLALLGLYWFSRRAPRIPVYWREIRFVFAGATRFEKAIMGILCLIAVGLLGASLGPATDADSLHYHLAAPLDWLRIGGIVERGDWYNYRLVGVGHALNMLGLAAGTDNFGAVLQVFGLAVALVALLSFARRSDNRLFISVLVLGSPFIVALTSAQKYQLLPAAATTTALALTNTRFKRFDGACMLLTFTCLAFAVGTSRYSFLVSGALLVCYALVAAYTCQRLPLALALAFGAFLVIAAPPYLTRMVLYQDPISPMLEGFKHASDPAALAYAEHLRASGDIPARWARWPTALILPYGYGGFAQIVGVGAVIWLLALQRSKVNVTLLVLAALLSPLIYLARGRFTARYFIEPYWWFVAAVAMTDWSWAKRVFHYAVSAQAVAVALMALYGAAVLFPAAVFEKQRERTLIEYGYGYTVAHWLNTEVPTDVTLLIESEVAYTHLERRFFNTEPWSYRILYHPSKPLDETMIYAAVDDVRRKGVTTIIAYTSTRDPVLQHMINCYSDSIGSPQTFRIATRNPFNRGTVIQLQVISLDWTGSRCGAAI